MKTQVLLMVLFSITAILYPQTKEKKSTFPEMIKVEGSTFTMGATPDHGSEAQADETPAHQVTVGSFLIAKTELTIGEFKEFIVATGYKTSADVFGGGWVVFGGPPRFVAGLNWSCDPKGNKRPEKEMNHPVIYVSWYDAVEYCNWLSKKEGLKEAYTINKKKKDPNNKSEDDELKWLVTCDFNSNGYRLPTEAEWEFAARGGDKSKGYEFSGSNKIDEVAWYSDNSREETHEVGKKQANELGIYDMTGNVFEWCWDWYGENYFSSSPETNPKGPSSGSDRVFRGSSWISEAEWCRVANRDRYPAFLLDLGFRVVRTR